jgi:pyruvate dehydrogenase E2 component (dihydrolipoamide acetyltransferase)/2-oxoisovalerate dehydrogenase E2 component (dihydrolipoyl transacylase)
MDFRLPELGEGVYEAELVSWLVQPGAAVKRGQGLLEVMTDKATMEVPSPFAGTVTALQAEPGQQIKVGQVVLSYDGVGAAANNGGVTDDKKMPLVAASPRPRVPASPLTVKAAPSVRLMARKLDIDLGRIRGSGPEGRILVEDLTRQVQAAKPESPKAEPQLDLGRPGTRLKLQGLRRKIAAHMVESKRTIPHYGYVDECDVTELVALRQELKETYAQAGVKLTYLAFFVKAVVHALKEVPLVNATLDEQAGEIVLLDRYSIGVAVATPGGLIVPVVHDADRKDLTQIARDIEQLSAAARTGKVRREDLRGGTFTITSIGGIGGLISTPVINHPEVGILGVGKVVKRPVYDDAGQLRPADLLYLSFSFDHRVVDGAVGAVFGNAIIRQLHKPAVLLLPDKLI